MLLEDETSALADVVDNAVLGRAAPAVVDHGRVLEFGETTTGGRNTGSSLRHDLLDLLLSREGRVAVLKLGNELRVVIFLVPQVAPAFGEDVTLLAKDRRHAVEGLSGKRA